MPFVQIQSSAEAPSPEREADLLRALSRIVSEGTGKDEKWVMTCVLPRLPMTMGGSSAPAAFLAVKNIGKFTNEATVAMTQKICDVVSDVLSVPKERIYVEFVDARPHLFGWNGQTFA